MVDTTKVLDILGNENRRKMLELLANRPYYVSELSEKLHLGPKAVIDHLKILEDAGIVESYTDRQRRKYFQIADNIRLEVAISPFSYAARTASLMLAEEEITFEEDRGLEDMATSLIDLLTSSLIEPGMPFGDLDDISTQLERMRKMQRELSMAQRYAQFAMTEMMGSCIEAIDRMVRDPIEAEMLLSLLRGFHDIDEICERLDILESELMPHIESLAESELVTVSRNGSEIYLVTREEKKEEENEEETE